MTVSDRPAYLARTLEALEKCDGIGKYVIEAFIEPSEKLDLVRLEMEKCNIPIIYHFNVHRKGLVNNNLDAICDCLDDNDTVVVVEEDIVLTKDALKFLEWGLEKYKHDPRIFNVTCDSHKHTGSPPPFVKNRVDVVHRRDHFACWGWATWCDRWNSDAIDKFVRIDSWAWAVKDYSHWKMLMEVYPEVSRSTHIGVNGTHTKGGRFEKIAMEADRNEWLVRKHPYENWREVSVTDTKMWTK